MTLLLSTGPHTPIPSLAPGGLVVSAAVAMAIGATAFSYARLRYWRRWWAPWWLGLGCHFLVNAGAGGVGWAVAYYLRWNPANSFWLNSVADGAAGEAMLRVDIVDFGFGAVKPVSSLLSRATLWFVAMLDAGAKSGIGSHLDALGDDDLRAAAYRVYFSDVQPSADVAPEVKAALLQAIEEADGAISNGDIAVGRERLRGVCLKWISDHALVDVP
jgi:multisubunit Na+/H+ antiporter MnhB subunit